MKVVCELVPGTKLDLLSNLVKELTEYIDVFDIPDSPLGKPYPSSLTVATYLKLITNKEVFGHIRLKDVNLNALISLVKSAVLFKIDAVVLLQGDNPTIGPSVSLTSTEQAIEVLKRELKGEELPKIGALLSLRYPKERILRRLRSNADLFLVLRLSRPSDIEDISKEAKKLGVELYPYILVKTVKSKRILSSLSGQYSVELNNLESFIENLRDLVNGVVISCPGDHKGLVEAVKIAKSVV